MLGVPGIREHAARIAAIASVAPERYTVHLLSARLPRSTLSIEHSSNTYRPSRKRPTKNQLLSDISTAESLRHGFGAILHPQPAKYPTRVGLHRVLSKVKLTPDLAITLTLAHPPQDLKLTLRYRSRLPRNPSRHR